MRVLCIDNKNPISAGRIPPVDWIFEGEVYHVLDEYTVCGVLFYTLVEKCRNLFPVKYKASRFIPLSDDEAVTESADHLLSVEEIK